ncbi:MAG: TonB-dependent receptor [Cytophagales bacterium]|nr:MAG: TonB-dependent receptor [Cytophagales bacterium]
MKTFPFLIIFLVTALGVTAQTTLSGRVLDERGRALPGANVFVKGTYDGANTDSTGAFRFRTSRRDTVTLAVSYVGFENYAQKLTLTGEPLTITVKMTELPNELNTVVITAGAFEASDSKRMTMLKSLDIVNIAGAGADITGAINFMPGAQRVGEQSGLFVRGGSGQEAKVVIDGLIVQNPFFSSLPDVQQRGRFDPFQFKGTSFSTGGYSAQYGQALSSVLLLSTTDKGSQDGLTLGLNLAGASVGYENATEKSSVSGTFNYTDLRPLFALVPQQISWQREPRGLGGSLTYRYQPTKNGILKAYGMYSDSRLAMSYRDPAQATATNETGQSVLDQTNRNLFINSTYTDSWDDARWNLNVGFSYSHDTDDMTVGAFDFSRLNRRAQVRAVITRALPNNGQLLFGAELHALRLGNAVFGQKFSLNDRYAAAFAEWQVYASRKLAVQVGVRGEYTSVIERFNMAPRLSMAYKTGQFSQISFAAGQFYQTPDYNYLFRNRQLAYERADHLILNYQIIKNKRTFRVESFYKNYAQLVRELPWPGQPTAFDANPFRFPIGQTNNTGNGHAQGFDVFWRDQKSVKGLDYWVTYSYVDTKRLFRNFTASATPTFVSNHNLSLITRRYFQSIRTSVNMTYAYTSGRPYYNPNRATLGRPESEFLTDLTPAVHNVNLGINYITAVKGNFMVLYATVDNLLNTRNVFTYRYTADNRTRYAVGPTTYRSFFVGGIIMLGKKAKVDLDKI